mgnify:FL=1
MNTFQNISNFNSWTNIEKDRYAVSVIKGLVMDATRQANSGHPGGPMSCADFAYVLFSNHLQFNPSNAQWFNRDRFILSGGHMSMLQYSLLLMIGWLDIKDIRNFRQFGSRTPGHPEVEIPGVECTTGPLGQGFAMGVGMAHAEAYLRNLFLQKKNNHSDKIINHFTYVLASDGDLQEPVTLGSASLAGHLGLSKLIVFYDANSVQISGKTSRSDSTDYVKVFDGFNWHVQVIDGHDHDSLNDAIRKAKESDKPSLIVGNTIMAKGTATMEGDHNTHGAPLPEEEIIATKMKLGLPPEEFYFPREVQKHFQKHFNIMKEKANEWDLNKKHACSSNEMKELISLCINDELRDTEYPEFKFGESIATRKAFGATLDKFSEAIPNLIGGSADLEPSNYTGNFAKKYHDFTAGHQSGRNIPFGVREFPMAAMLNGMALHGGIIPFGGTFLVFSDYERPALRLGAIQNARVIHEFTHDSFYVGEDGPTHQPIEHAMSLRSIPNLNVFRPADAKETAICFKIAIEEKHTPSSLLLTRQGVPVLEQNYDEIEKGVRKGAYIVKDCDEPPELVFIATGSEVSLAIASSNLFSEKNIRIVSMPCMEIFDKQTLDYKRKIIPHRRCLKVTIEAGVTQGWEKFSGVNGLNIGIDHYGASAPGKILAKEFGFTPKKIEKKIRNHLKNLL